MNAFRSHVLGTISMKVMRNMMLLFPLFVASFFVDLSGFIPIEIGLWEVGLAYFALLIIQAFYTNNDLLIEGERIVVQASFFSGLRRKQFHVLEIEEIVFKEDGREPSPKDQPESFTKYLWTEWLLFWLIPPEYKWIQIKTKHGQLYPYFFFGIPYDYYEQSGDLFFENMFLELAKRNIKVRWQSTEDTHYAGLQEKADGIRWDLNR